MLFSLLAAVYRGRGHAAFMIMSVDNWVKFVYLDFGGLMLLNALMSDYNLFCAILIIAMVIGLLMAHSALVSARKKAIMQFSLRYLRIKDAVTELGPSVNPVRRVNTIEVQHNSLVQFRRFDANKFFSEFVAGRKRSFEKVLQDIAENRVAYEAFQSVQEELVDKKSDWEHLCDRCKMSFSFYSRAVDSLCKSIMPDIVQDVVYRVNSRYTSPAGRNQYLNTFNFSEGSIRKALLCASTAVQSDPIAEFKKRQRSLMTPKLRYQILQRDGFRCVICGRGVADGVRQLEVDHIKPVSKGGVTEPDNLRTLCWNCNQGKKDRYVEGGLN